MFRKMAKILYMSIVIAIILFLFARRQKVSRETGDYLKKEEGLIFRRYGCFKEKFRLCAYPLVSKNAGIINSPDTKTLRVEFAQQDKHLYGLHFYFTLLLRPYLVGGYLEFYVRKANSSSLLDNMEVYLREGPFKKNMVKGVARIKIDSNWKKVIIPLKDFSLYHKEKGINPENRAFSWEVQEILFSTDSSRIDNPVVVFIKDIKIKDGEKTIYGVL